MSHPAVTASPDEPVAGVARLMAARKLRRLPVLDWTDRPPRRSRRADPERSTAHKVIHLSERPVLVVR
jgi:hypothetical protein